MSKKEGLRFNEGKIDYTQLSPIAMALESLVFMYGEGKYGRNNWKNFKKDEETVVIEMLQSATRHLLAIQRGEFFDPESKMPHAAHVVWNMNRIIDLHYLGLNHGKDGKDLYHQPLKTELPPVPTEKNFKEIWGFKPKGYQKPKEEDVARPDEYNEKYNIYDEL